MPNKGFLFVIANSLSVSTKPLILFKEWFQAFSQSARVTLHIENIYGENSHHKIESCYKGLARSLKDALAIDKRIKNSIPSTKGSI